VPRVHGGTTLQTLDWCLKLGVNTVTVYAFSLENFKRSKAEVDGLMDLCRAKFEVLMGEKYPPPPPPPPNPYPKSGGDGACNHACPTIDRYVSPISSPHAQPSGNTRTQLCGYRPLYPDTHLLLSELCSELIQKHGVRINIIGDIGTLPPDLQKVVGRIVTMSRHNTRLVLNVALAYTSRHEITEAVKCVAHGVGDGCLHES
jgi:undecaprenyl pyrophosphate synthase